MLVLVCVRYVGDGLVCDRSIIILRTGREVALGLVVVIELQLWEVRAKTFSKFRLHIESKVLEGELA